MNYYNCINTIHCRPLLCINITVTFPSLFVWAGVSSCPFLLALSSLSLFTFLKIIIISGIMLSPPWSWRPFCLSSSQSCFKMHQKSKYSLNSFLLNPLGFSFPSLLFLLVYNLSERWCRCILHPTVAQWAQIYLANSSLLHPTPLFFKNFFEILHHQIALIQWFSTGGKLDPQGTFGHICRCFWLSQVGWGVATDF